MIINQSKANKFNKNANKKPQEEAEFIPFPV
jgi:hypothetical protein